MQRYITASNSKFQYHTIRIDSMQLIAIHIVDNRQELQEKKTRQNNEHGVNSQYSAFFDANQCATFIKQFEAYGFAYQ